LKIKLLIDLNLMDSAQSAPAMIEEKIKKEDGTV
jgi:hypothetical protein